MAKQVALGKRAKISEAEKHMIIAVLCASIALGICASLTIFFFRQITFNADVITAQEKSIASYSSTIKKTGICRAPKGGEIYSQEELEKCNPDNIELAEIPNTLRSNILENLASNEALNSVPTQNNAECYNQSTGQKYTYKELKKDYDEAEDDITKEYTKNRLKNCSALRVVPDALPAYKNVEALNASLDKLFRLSNREPDSIGNSGSSNKTEIPGTLGELYDVTVNLSINSEAGATTSVLDNIERSIREFDIQRATIEWESETSLGLQAQAKAYYMDKSTIKEKVVTMKPEGKK